ncbi:MAG: hypothetical protein HQ564_07340 [Candidatus Saganbacteria bacterium]|nr:hypothetical protein [Candidatus Saganbacteria bacterium]
MKIIHNNNGNPNHPIGNRSHPLRAFLESKGIRSAASDSVSLTMSFTPTLIRECLFGKNPLGRYYREHLQKESKNWDLDRLKIVNKFLRHIAKMKVVLTPLEQLVLPQLPFQNGVRLKFVFLPNGDIDDIRFAPADWFYSYFVEEYFESNILEIGKDYILESSVHQDCCIPLSTPSDRRRIIHLLPNEKKIISIDIYIEKEESLEEGGKIKVSEKVVVKPVFHDLLSLDRLSQKGNSAVVRIFQGDISFLLQTTFEMADVEKWRPNAFTVIDSKRGVEIPDESARRFLARGIFDEPKEPSRCVGAGCVETQNGYSSADKILIAILVDKAFQHARVLGDQWEGWQHPDFGEFTLSI